MKIPVKTFVKEHTFHLQVAKLRNSIFVAVNSMKIGSFVVQVIVVY